MAEGKSPAFSFYVDDWLGSTTIAQMDAHGERAFLRLLAHAWGDPDCSLPDDDGVLMKLGLLDDESFARNAHLLRAKFVPCPFRSGRIYNPRLHSERLKQLERAIAGRKGGVNSGKARRSAPRSKRQANVHDPPSKREAKPNLPDPASSSFPAPLFATQTPASRLGRRQAGAFAKLTKKDLLDTGRLMEWLAEQQTKNEPVIRDSSANRLRIVACAERGLEVGENPVALFASLVAGEQWEKITQHQEARAAKRLKDWECRPSQSVNASGAIRETISMTFKQVPGDEAGRNAQQKLLHQLEKAKA